MVLTISGFATVLALGRGTLSDINQKQLTIIEWTVPSTPCADAVFPDLTVARTGGLEITVSWTVNVSESYSRCVSSLSFYLSLSLSFSLSLFLSLSRSLSRSLSIRHTHQHTHAHTHSLSLSLPPPPLSWTVDASECYPRCVSVGACLESLVVCVSVLRGSLQVAHMLLQSHEARRTLWHSESSTLNPKPQTLNPKP